MPLLDMALAVYSEIPTFDESAIEAVDMHAYKEAQYDKLADAVRHSLDMDLVYDILNRRV